MTLRLLLLAVAANLCVVAADLQSAAATAATAATPAVGGGENETSSLPDSLLTEEHVYLHLFTDRNLSERIMSEMRRRGCAGSRLQIWQTK